MPRETHFGAFGPSGQKFNTNVCLWHKSWPEVPWNTTLVRASFSWPHINFVRNQPLCLCWINLFGQTGGQTHSDTSPNVEWSLIIPNTPFASEKCKKRTVLGIRASLSRIKPPSNWIKSSFWSRIRLKPFLTFLWNREAKVFFNWRKNHFYLFGVGFQTFSEKSKISPHHIFQIRHDDHVLSLSLSLTLFLLGSCSLSLSFFLLYSFS